MTLAASWAEKRRAAGVVAPVPMVTQLPACAFVVAPAARRGRPRRVAAPAHTPVLPEAVPAPELPVATAASTPLEDAPSPPAAAPVPAPSAAARRAIAAPPPREEPPVARKRHETLERRPRQAPAEEPPKPRITHKDITAERELELIRSYKAGNRRAGDILLQVHEPIIYKTALNCFGRGLDDDDVLQAGRMGFLHGITKFDESRGFRLTTYATWWVRSYVQNALVEEGSTIVVNRTVDNQIAEARSRGGEIPERLFIQRGLRRLASIDAPVPGHDDDGAMLGDLTAGPDAGPEATLADEDAQARRRELIAKAMTRLTPQEQEIVRRRMLEEEPETLNEVGRSYGVCRERIRQIEVKALEKLKCALRKSLAEDDAVLWGSEPPS